MQWLKKRSFGVVLNPIPFIINNEFTKSSMVLLYYMTIFVCDIRSSTYASIEYLHKYKVVRVKLVSSASECA